MIAAILRAQLLSMRPKGRGGNASRVAATIGMLFFCGIFAMIAWGAMIFFSRPDNAAYFVPALTVGMMFVMLYWQLAPVITASVGASIDLRKLLSYPIPHNTLFLVEILLRITTCVEMLIVVAGPVMGLLRNPLFGLRAAPLILGGALIFCAMNILLSAGTRNLLERIFLRSRLREVMFVVIILASVAPRIVLSMKIPKARFFQFVPAQFFWPWSAPAHVMLNDAVWSSAAAMLLWFACAWIFSRWQFERGIRYDESQPRQTVRDVRKGDTLADRLFTYPSRFLKDPIAALVEKELRTLSRIPRFRLVYLMSTFFGMCLYLPAAMRGGPPSVFMAQAGLPVMSLYGLLMLGQISYWNSLGFDRSAVQAYFSWPLNFRDVLLAKNITVICLLIPQILLISALIRLVHIAPGPAKILETVIVMLIASLYWMGIGNLCSVRMPRALDPAKMNQMSNKLQALTIFAAPFLLLPLVLAYWSRWYFESELAFAGIVLLAGIIGGIIYWVTLDSAVAMAHHRRESIITLLSVTEGPLSTT